MLALFSYGEGAPALMEFEIPCSVISILPQLLFILIFIDWYLSDLLNTLLSHLPSHPIPNLMTLIQTVERQMLEWEHLSILMNFYCLIRPQFLPPNCMLFSLFYLIYFLAHHLYLIYFLAHHLIVIFQTQRVCSKTYQFCGHHPLVREI